MRTSDEGAGTVGSDVMIKLREDIVDGRYVPGAKLKFADLQGAYEVGMGTLREALVGLVAEGIVTADAGKGFRVAEVSQEDLADLVATRIDIERRVIEDSVMHGDDEWEARVLTSWHMLSKVYGLPFNDRLQPSRDWIKRHRDFHYALVSACRQKRILQFRNILYDQAERYRLLSVRHGELQEDEHALLRDAALARDFKLAGDLLVKHIKDSASLALEFAPQLVNENQAHT